LSLGTVVLETTTCIKHFIKLSLFVIASMSVSILTGGTVARVLINSLDQSFKRALILHLVLLFRSQPLSSLRTQLIVLVCIMRIFARAAFLVQLIFKEPVKLSLELKCLHCFFVVHTRLLPHFVYQFLVKVKGIS
jgi:hypothetical protein